jgi:hypothetical protein
MRVLAQGQIPRPCRQSLAILPSKTIALSLGLILVAEGLYAADPFEGTWKLNESNSKLTPGTDKDTKIVYNSRLIRDKVTVTTDGLEGDGTPIRSSRKANSTAKITRSPAIPMRICVPTRR